MVKKEKEPMNVERHINHCMNHSNKKKTVAYLNIANSVKLTEARMSIGRDTVQFLGHTSSVINNLFYCLKLMKLHDKNIQIQSNGKY